MGLSEAERDAYMRVCRDEAVRFIEGMIPAESRNHPAYRAVLDYPLREAKGLRPALAIAACRSLGGGLSEVVPTAAVLELLHNAFLVHDDVEDGSELRRHAPTLSAQLGIPLAVHTGDTMFGLALTPLLENMRFLDLGRALRVLEWIATVMQRTAEGQALELTWIAEQKWDISAAAYVEMVTLKTAWYTFAGPLVAGAAIAQAPAPLMEDLRRFALLLGVAFQVRDDNLNLLASEAATGKELWGDLWEGKRTLVLSLFFEGASEKDAETARTILRKPRPGASLHASSSEELRRTLATLSTKYAFDDRSLLAVRQAFTTARAETFKTEDEVARLRSMLDPGIAKASRMAREYAGEARALWASLRRNMVPSIHSDLIESIVDFTFTRDC